MTWSFATVSGAQLHYECDSSLIRLWLVVLQTWNMGFVQHCPFSFSFNSIWDYFFPTYLLNGLEK